MANKKTKNTEETNDTGIMNLENMPSTTLFAIREAYKTIRTNLILNLEDKPCHLITITSSIAGEGKSTSSINLAIAIAQLEKKVLMIDGDLRKKRASRYLNYSSTKGLTDVITGQTTFEKAVKVTQYSNFDFLSSGSTVNNPAEILASRAMNNLLDEIAEKYDYIIVDTPPVNIVSDALPIIKKSDGVILVARELVITTKDFQKLITNLQIIDANILGIIYIGTDSTQPYYHKRGYYNKSYYNKYGKYNGYDTEQNN